MDGRFRYWIIVLKFMLELDAQKYVGVHVTNQFPENISENQRVSGFIGTGMQWG